MRPFSLALAALFCCLPALAQALELSSLRPATAAPGDLVILSGRDWPEAYQLLLGETAVSSERLSATDVRFQVPQLPPGDYAIGISSEGRKLPAVTQFILRVHQPAPQIDSLVPDQIPLCRGFEQEEILLGGRNFAPGAALLLDDSALAVKSRSQGSITALLPPVPAGLHRIEVVNPDGQKSIAATLNVVKQPEIDHLEIGNDQVTSYQIRIVGVNFSPQSKLMLNGTPITNRSEEIVAGNDRISYIDCTTLVYQRYPLTGQPRDLAFQILNPDGQVSNTVRIRAN